MQRPILIVEDSQNDLELLLIAMERSRIPNPVVVVADGQEALDYLQREGRFSDRQTLDPEFIILDIKMPKVSGLEALQVIRGSPSLNLIPVVIFTSSRQEVDVLQAYNLGVNAYVIKDTDYEAFTAAVGRITSMWASHNETPPSFRLKRRQEGNVGGGTQTDGRIRGAHSVACCHPPGVGACRDRRTGKGPSRSSLGVSSRSDWTISVDRTGFKPVTNGLEVRCSAN